MPPFSPFTGKYWAKLMHRTCAGLCHAERGDQGDYRQKLAQSGKVSTEVRQPMSNRRHTLCWMSATARLVN